MRRLNVVVLQCSIAGTSLVPRPESGNEAMLALAGSTDCHGNIYFQPYSHFVALCFGLLHLRCLFQPHSTFNLLNSYCH